MKSSMTREDKGDLLIHLIEMTRFDCICIFVLQEELQRDKRITWVITFFAAWSPPCVTFSSVFAELSNE
jgi:hypothetical protein